MANHVEYRNCSLCGVQPFNAPRVNHVLHLLITAILVFFGFFGFGFGLGCILWPIAVGWVVLWITLVMLRGNAKCASCGLSSRAAYRKAKRDYQQEVLEERNAEREDARAYFNENGPEVGSRAKITSGPHKGKFGTVVSNDGFQITIADKAGRTMTLPISAFHI